MPEMDYIPGTELEKILVSFEQFNRTLNHFELMAVSEIDRPVCTLNKVMLLT